MTDDLDARAALVAARLKTEYGGFPLRDPTAEIAAFARSVAAEAKRGEFERGFAAAREAAANVIDGSKFRYIDDVRAEFIEQIRALALVPAPVPKEPGHE